MATARTLTIPSVFAAVDRVTEPMRRMQAATSSWGRAMELTAARGERLLGRLPSVFGDADKQMLGFAKSAAIAGAAIGGGSFTINKILDYQDELANLKALTGASAGEFARFKTQITEVAMATRQSSVDVAKAFTAIANNQPALLESADNLAAVTKASILLAKAGRMELEPAGMAVTDILNQWGYGAEHAAKLVDMLAAGSVAGSSEINNTQEALKRFGTVAANLNIKPIEAIAALELVSPFKKGEEAGTGFTRILSEMAKGRAQDPLALKDWARLGVNIKTVTDKSQPFAVRLQEIAKIAGDNTAIIHTFGVEHAALATALLTNAGRMQEYIDKVDTAGAAERMAAENTSTLRDRINQLTGKFVTLATTTNTAAFSINAASGVIGFLTDHMEGILNVGVPMVAMFVTAKGAILAMNAAAWLAMRGTAALNFIMGVATVVQGKYATACFATTAGMNGMATASFFLEAGLLGSLGIIGITAASVAILGEAFFNGRDASIDYVEQLKKTKDGLYEVAKPATDAQIRMQLFNKEMEKFRDLQQDDAHVMWKLKMGTTFEKLVALAAWHLMQRIPGTDMWAAKRDEKGNLVAPKPEDFGIDSTGNVLPAVNPKKAAQEMNTNSSTTNTNKVEITIADQTGNASVTKNPGGVPIDFKPSQAQ